MRIGTLITAALLTSLLLAAFGLRNAEIQRQMLADPQTITVNVIESEPIAVGGGRYAPQITYRYWAAGRQIEKQRFAPLPASGSLTWAERQIRKFPKGQSATAFYDPKNPDRTFLVPIIQLKPYSMLLAILPLLTATLWALERGSFFLRPPKTESVPKSTWFRPAQGDPTNARLNRRLILAAAWYLWGLLVALHALTIITPDNLIAPSIAISLYASLGLIPLLRARRLISRNNTYGQPDMLINAHTFAADQTIVARITLPIHRPISIQHASISLVCDKAQGIVNTERLFANAKPFAQNLGAIPGQHLTGHLDFQIPKQKRRPSSTFSIWKYPRTDWKLELTVKPQRGPIHILAFPIHVQTNTNP